MSDNDVRTAIVPQTIVPSRSDAFFARLHAHKHPSDSRFIAPISGLPTLFLLAAMACAAVMVLGGLESVWFWLGLPSAIICVALAMPRLLRDLYFPRDLSTPAGVVRVYYYALMQGRWDLAWALLSPVARGQPVVWPTDGRTQHEPTEWAPFPLSGVPALRQYWHLPDGVDRSRLKRYVDGATITSVDYEDDKLALVSGSVDFTVRGGAGGTQATEDEIAALAIFNVGGALCTLIFGYGFSISGRNEKRAHEPRRFPLAKVVVKDDKGRWSLMSAELRGGDDEFVAFGNYERVLRGEKPLVSQAELRVRQAKQAKATRARNLVQGRVGEDPAIHLVAAKLGNAIGRSLTVAPPLRTMLLKETLRMTRDQTRAVLSALEAELGGELPRTFTIPISDMDGDTDVASLAAEVRKLATRTGVDLRTLVPRQPSANAAGTKPINAQASRSSGQRPAVPPS